jgi:hypothetical protein
VSLAFDGVYKSLPFLKGEQEGFSAGNIRDRSLPIGKISPVPSLKRRGTQVILGGENNCPGKRYVCVTEKYSH